jgi:hypothetical protein
VAGRADGTGGPAKAAGAEAARRRALRRLADDVAALRAALARARAELLAAGSRERVGPLSPEVARRVRALRLELEGYQLDLRRAARELERLRWPAPPGSAGAGRP